MAIPMISLTCSKMEQLAAVGLSSAENDTVDQRGAHDDGIVFRPDRPARRCSRPAVSARAIRAAVDPPADAAIAEHASTPVSDGSPAGPVRPLALLRAAGSAWRASLGLCPRFLLLSCGWLAFLRLGRVRRRGSSAGASTTTGHGKRSPSHARAPDNGRPASSPAPPTTSTRRHRIGIVHPPDQNRWPPIDRRNGGALTQMRHCSRNSVALRRRRCGGRRLPGRGQRRDRRRARSHRCAPPVVLEGV